MMKICPQFRRCGGCQYLNIDYEKQIEKKIEKLKELFGKEPDEVYSSPKIYYYRNRMDYAVGPGFKIGLKEKGKWWSIVDINECYLMSEEANTIRNKFREWLKENNIEPWNNRTHTGIVRYIVIREGKFSGDRQVQIIISKTENTEIFTEFYNKIKDLCNSFYLGILERITDISYADKYILLKGKEYIEEKILNKKFLICPECFFQSNSYTAEILVKKVLEFSETGKKCFDLYSGVGLFSLFLAENYEEVIAIEYVESSIKMLKENMKINKIDNINTIVEKCEKIKNLEADTIVLDPPRAGTHPKLIRNILRSKPKKIIYVSCNPKAQKNDLNYLLKFYEIENFVFVDQFPHTQHMETIISLNLKE